jgi:hypothetical protein
VRVLTCAMVLLLCGGCWNADNHVVQLGDVSIGQQLIDLKTAHDSGAITDTEYAEVKAKLIALADMCNADQTPDQQN